MSENSAIQNTFVSKALWYRTFEKPDCSLIWNLYRMYQSIHPSNCANFMKINVQFSLEVKMCFIMLKYYGYLALYNGNLHRLTCKKHFLQKVKWKENAQFFSWNFHTIFGEQIAIFYQIIFKSGKSEKKINVLNLQRWKGIS